MIAQATTPTRRHIGLSEFVAHFDVVQGIVDDHCFVRIITQRPRTTVDDDIKSTCMI